MMIRYMLKSKIHRATVTGSDLHYEGSIAVDQNLLDAADILAGEQVHVLNINNGERLITYAIPARRGSGTIMLNGPAARSAQPGDVVVILTYAGVDESALKTCTPKVILVDAKNRLKKR